MVNKCTKKLLIDLGNYDYYREKRMIWKEQNNSLIK